MVPSIALHDGEQIPQLGFGVFLVPPPETAEAVTTALLAGYRHIDTAAAYRNEAGVSQAIDAAGLQREDVFVTTKLWNDHQGYEESKQALRDSLNRLEMTHVDLYLIHWPAPALDKYVDTWRAFVELQQEGLARSIGVSNFNAEHLEKIIDATGVTPVVNQVELHPAFQQRGLRDAHAEHGIVTEAWSPLARGGAILSEQSIVAIAETHGKTTGPSGPPLAHPARQRRHPQVGHAGADRREPRPVRLPALGGRDGGDRRVRRRRAHRARPGQVRSSVAAHHR